jgi:hypothetical protein
MLDFIRGLLQTNPARFVGYATVAATWIVVKGSELLGSPVAPESEVVLAVGTIVAFIATEVIRRLVYSPAAVAKIIDQTTPANQPAMEAGVLGGPPPAQPADLPGGGQ